MPPLAADLSSPPQPAIKKPIAASEVALIKFLRVSPLYIKTPRFQYAKIIANDYQNSKQWGGQNVTPCFVEKLLFFALCMVKLRKKKKRS